MNQANAGISKQNFQFVIIDNDNINNYCARLMIQSVYEGFTINIFSDPVEGLEYFKTDFQKTGMRAILFLDLSMPVMSGWDFIDEFEMLDESIKRMVSIQVVSSSINQKDKKRALSYPLVAGFISKPITKEFYQSLSEDVFRTDTSSSTEKKRE